MNWTDTELKGIAAADELQIETMRADGTFRNPVTIWVVRVNNGIYVRAVGGPTGTWFRHASERHQARISAVGVSKVVTLAVVTDADLNHAVDTSYRAKYAHYGERIVGSTLTEQAHAATLKLEPAV